jgi:hypothetical protein
MVWARERKPQRLGFYWGKYALVHCPSLYKLSFSLSSQSLGFSLGYTKKCSPKVLCFTDSTVAGCLSFIDLLSYNGGPKPFTFFKQRSCIHAHEAFFHFEGLQLSTGVLSEAAPLIHTVGEKSIKSATNCASSPT